jgi:hypothetical protein
MSEPRTSQRCTHSLLLPPPLPVLRRRVVVRGSSAVKVSGSSRWTLYDQSRVFVVDSAVVLKDNATLHLLNSTMVLINSRLVVKGGSQVSAAARAGSCCRRFCVHHARHCTRARASTPCVC